MKLLIAAALLGAFAAPSPSHADPSQYDGPRGGWHIHFTDQVVNRPEVAVGIRAARDYFGAPRACPQGIRVVVIEGWDDPTDDAAPTDMGPALGVGPFHSCVIGLNVAALPLRAPDGIDTSPASTICAVVAHEFGHAALGLEHHDRPFGDQRDPEGVMHDNAQVPPQCAAAYREPMPRTGLVPNLPRWRAVARQERANSWCRWQQARCRKDRPALARLALR